MKITVLPARTEFAVDADTPVLSGALAAGMNLPHSCRGGNCGSCRAQWVSGDFHYPNGRPLGLSDGEIAAGMLLLCQARARSDLTLQVRSISLAGEATLKRLPCRIERWEKRCPDVMSVFLRLPAAEEFSFQAGQYIDVLLAGGRRRSFSIASPPQGSHLLELHIRHVPGGIFTDPLFKQAPEKKVLTIEGPLGGFFYRESDAPMLMIGGGTGLAPLLSIIRHIDAHGLPRRMKLFWGCRTAQDLYADDEIRAIMRGNPRLDYVPVLSEPFANWTGATGFVHDEVLRRIPDPAVFDVYASGPPAMVLAVRSQFSERGVAADRIYVDSFDYAPDSVERHRKMALKNA